MASKIKIIIVVSLVIAALVLSYIFFFKDTGNQPNLTSSFGVADLLPNKNAESAPVDTEFLATLLSIKNIRLNDTIFKDIAFTNLRDSSIVLVQDGNEGRKNPFAPIGVDTELMPTNPDLFTQPN